MRYTAFISYSHAADGHLAEAVQLALHRFANPWYRRRSLSIFRDKTSLAANPALWPAIEAALAQSDWFLYMASPRSAQSPWVKREMQWWLDHRPHERMLMVLTDGDLKWDPIAGDFDWARTTAVARDLEPRVKDEPLFVDLRWTRSREDLSLRHSQFRGAILDIAAPLHGKPKEDLDGEDVRQHRRNKAWAWSAGAALLALFVMAATAAVYALVQRNEAVRQRDEAIGRLYAQQLARVDALARTDPALALAALDETVRSAGEMREFTWDLYAKLADRVVFAIGGVRNVPGNTQGSVSPVFDVSADGHRLAVGSVRRSKRSRSSDRAFTSEVLVWDTRSGAHVQTLLLTETRESNVPTVESVAFSADGRYLAAGGSSVDGIVKLWEIETGRELMSTQTRSTGHLKFVGQGLVGISDFGGGTLWRAPFSTDAGVPISSKSVGAVAASTDNQELILATAQTIEHINVSTGQRASAANPASISFTMAVAAGGAWIAQDAGDAIRVWRVGITAPRLFERGHRESGSPLSFSGDGRFLASGGTDHTVRIWDVERGIPLMTLRGPMGNIRTLRFSTDGNRLAAGAADSTVFVWDIAGSPVRPTQRVEVGGSACTSFSVNSTALVTSQPSVPSNVTVHRASELSPRAVITTAGAVQACGQSMNGTTYFALEQDSRLLLVDTTTGAVRARTTVRTDTIDRPRQARISDSGDIVAAQAGAGTIRIWDGRSGAEQATIETGGRLGGLFELVSDGQIVAQVSEGRASWIGLWDVKTKKRLAAVPVPTESYGDAYAICPARRLIAKTYANGELTVVDLGANRVLRQLTWKGTGDISFNRATAIVFSDDCSLMAVGDKVGQISVWNVSTGEHRYRVRAHTGLQVVGGTALFNADGVSTLAFTADRRTLASGGGSTVAGRGELKLWDAARGLLLATLPAESGDVKHVAFAEDGRSLGALLKRTHQDSRGAATIIEIWRGRAPERALLTGLSEAVETLAFAPDGETLVAEGPANAVTWNLATRRPESVVQRLSRQSPDAAPASPRVRWGQTTVFAQEHVLMVDGRAAVRRLEPPEGRDQFHTQPVTVLRVLRDDRVLSLAGRSHSRERPAELALWDIAAGRPIREAFEPSNLVTTVVLSPDERTFVTVGALSEVGQPGFVHLWDAQRFVRIRALIGHRANVTAVAFSSDGTMLATGDAAGFVRIWDVPK
jgi:WD40 repeat protein